MSHFSTIKVQIKDSDVLKETLDALGYDVQQGIAVRGYRGDTAEAEYVIRRPGSYDIGFRKKDDESYEIISDWSMIRINRTEFVQKIKQTYAHKMLLRTVAEQGFDVEAEEVMEDGTVKVVVGRWV